MNNEFIFSRVTTEKYLIVLFLLMAFFIIFQYNVSLYGAYWPVEKMAWHDSLKFQRTKTTQEITSPGLLITLLKGYMVKLLIVRSSSGSKEVEDFVSSSPSHSSIHILTSLCRDITSLVHRRRGYLSKMNFQYLKYELYLLHDVGELRVVTQTKPH